MSDRIEAIAAQCRAENWERADLDYMQFAKLILEEVMQELFINGHEDAFDCLNKHFGVEQ
jgi:hypothetical protein